MRENYQPQSGAQPRYPTIFQDVVNNAESTLLQASHFFGHLKLPVEMADGKLTRMTVFPEGQDPLRLLMERSPAHLDRGISRTISSLTVELRAAGGGDDFGRSLADEVTFGQGSYTTDRVLNRMIERNFPAVVTLAIREPDGWHAKSTFLATIQNLSLDEGVWRRLLRALDASPDVEVNDRAHELPDRLSLKTRGDGAFAVLTKCQQALIAAHQPRIRFFFPRRQTLSIDEWQLGASVERFYNEHCRESFKLLANERELRKAALPPLPGAGICYC